MVENTVISVMAALVSGLGSFLLLGDYLHLLSSGRLWLSSCLRLTLRAQVGCSYRSRYDYPVLPWVCCSATLSFEHRNWLDDWPVAGVCRNH